jgi:threonine efflux protein
MMNDTIAVLGPLAAVWLIGVLTPGPNFFATLHMAARHGRRAGLLTVAGIGVGLAFWALVGLLGIRFLFTTVPMAAVAVKLIGAGYLVWMGAKLWKSAGAPPAAAAADRGWQHAFRFGLLTNLANAKTAAFAASLFAVALPPHASLGLFLAAFATIVSMSVGWYGACAIAGSRGPVMRLYARFQKWLMRVAGAVFVGFGVKLALDR